MIEDIFEGSHAEFAASESYISPAERIWTRWAGRVERLLGHNLDGNNVPSNPRREGYSLDDAYATWDAGVTSEAYAEEVREEKAKLAAERAMG